MLPHRVGADLRHGRRASWRAKRCCGSRCQEQLGHWATNSPRRGIFGMPIRGMAGNFLARGGMPLRRAPGLAKCFGLDTAKLNLFGVPSKVASWECDLAAVLRTGGQTEGTETGSKPD